MRNALIYSPPGSTPDRRGEQVIQPKSGTSRNRQFACARVPYGSRRRAEIEKHAAEMRRRPEAIVTQARRRAAAVGWRTRRRESPVQEELV